MWADLRRWQGLVLIALVAVSTLWLAATGQLGLYIAPRHELFATSMSAIGLVAVLGSAVRLTRHHHTDHASRRGRIVSATGMSLALFVAATLLVLPPATLSSATANQRDINSTAVGGGLGEDTGAVEDAAAASDDAFAAFTVLDWATLLRQTSDTAVYDGRPVDVVGFVTADPEDPENMFYVSRFLISHCAIDAQPVGVPVYLENWQGSFENDQWVQATGGMETNRSDRSSLPIALVPDDIVGVDQPDEPYLY